MPADPPPPDVLALLRTVREQYEEDLPRLVLADWLEEHGEEARAELIRVTVERARPQGDWVGWARRAERETQLRHDHGKAWLGRALGLVDSWAADRGLIALRMSAAHFTAPVFRTEAGLLPWVCSLHLSRLRQHYLPGLAFVAELPSLWRLGLAENRLVADGPIELAAAAVRTGAAALDLRATGLSPGAAAELVEAPEAAGLRELGLTGNLLGVPGTGILAEAPVLAGLTRLMLGYNTIGSKGAGRVASAAHFAGLRVLSLEANGVDDEGAEALASSRHLSGLRELNLRANRLTDAGARALAESPHLTGLTSLDLSENPITHVGRTRLRERFGRRVHLGTNRPEGE